MKTNFVCVVFVLLAPLFLMTLDCNLAPVEPPPGNNLLSNGSFETDHTPTLVGWRLGNPQLAQLVNEAPPEGGNWSLQLTADWAPTSGFAYAPVVNVKSDDIVELSAFVRAAGRFGGRGIIMLVQGPNFYAQRAKSASSTDTLWNSISITDTLTLGQGDTLWVVLSSPITEIVPFQQLFDLVKAEKIAK